MRTHILNSIQGPTHTQTVMMEVCPPTHGVSGTYTSRCIHVCLSSKRATTPTYAFEYRLNSLE